MPKKYVFTYYVYMYVCIYLSQAQQKMIQKLDQTLQNAVRLGDMNAIQVVCVTQWNLCMPLLQHNIRKSIRKQLIRVAEVLEEINRYWQSQLAQNLNQKTPTRLQHEHLCFISICLA